MSHAAVPLSPAYDACGIDAEVRPYMRGLSAGLIDERSMVAEAEQFWRDGYVVLRGMFTAEEMGHVRKAITADARMNGRVEELRRRIAGGERPSFETILVWNDTGGQDIYAKLTRNYRIFERLCCWFRDHAYVYHNKVALKYPGISGFRYHQDYFYWYGMGNLFPDMATAQIAVDPSRRANGCLKVIPGSHRLGRIDHRIYGVESDTGVDDERLTVIRDRMGEDDIELDPGDVVVFHANLLHGSGDNESTEPRRALLGCYNTRRNNPYRPSSSGCPFFTPQSSVIEPIIGSDVDVLPDFDLRYS